MLGIFITHSGEASLDEIAPAKAAPSQYSPSTSSEVNGNVIFDSLVNQLSNFSYFLLNAVIPYSIAFSNRTKASL